MSDWGNSTWVFKDLIRLQNSTNISALIRRAIPASRGLGMLIIIQMKSFQAAFTLVTGITPVIHISSRRWESLTSWTSLIRVKTTWLIRTPTSSTCILTCRTWEKHKCLTSSIKFLPSSKRLRYPTRMTAHYTCIPHSPTSASVQAQARATKNPKQLKKKASGNCPYLTRSLTLTSRRARQK